MSKVESVFIICGLSILTHPIIIKRVSTFLKKNLIHIPVIYFSQLIRVGISRNFGINPIPSTYRASIADSDTNIDADINIHICHVH